MAGVLESITIDKLLVNPENPNRMAQVDFNKLVRNIGRLQRYEPLVVRRHPVQEGFFEIINGHHRLQALRQLGYESADCMVWDVDDDEVKLLLLSLNRLCGRDDIGKRLELMKQLKKKMPSSALGRLLPENAIEIERLTNLKLPVMPASDACQRLLSPLMFFVNDEQKAVIEKSLAAAEGKVEGEGRAARRACALVNMAERFLAGICG